MQITSKYLDCAVTKLIKNELKINKINSLGEIIVLKNTSAIDAQASLKLKKYKQPCFNKLNPAR